MAEERRTIQLQMKPESSARLSGGAYVYPQAAWDQESHLAESRRRSIYALSENKRRSNLYDSALETSNKDAREPLDDASQSPRVRIFSGRQEHQTERL
jgi:hypothetical protein